MPNIFFEVSALAYCILITAVFLSKKNNNTLTNLTYVVMILITIVELVMGITYNLLGFFAMSSTLTILASKLFYCAKISWMVGFSYYIYVVTSEKKTDSDIVSNQEKFIPFTINMIMYVFRNKEDREELKRKGDHTFFFINRMLLSLIIAIVLDIVTLIIPLSLSINSKIITISGPVVILSNIVSIVCVLAMVILMIKNRQIVKEKSLKAFVWLNIFLLAGMILQMIVPEIPVITVLHGFATTVIYYTVENPDLNAIERLNIATKQAESANSAKSNFLSSMSHEIRTPLNAIVGFSQSLAKEEISGPARDEVKEILNASTGLLETINGILDVSKLEANKVEILKSDYSTRRLINEIVTTANNRLGSKPLDLKFEIDEKLPPALVGDFLKLKQIILNILTNSIKYTKVGHITLKIDSMTVNDKCMLTIIVEDTGIGMTKEDLDVVFVKFQRFELDKNINIAGTGLGMAITKGLVELMNGELNIESEYGKGTTTTIILEQDISKKELANEEELREIQKIEPFNAKGQSVLVVDDNKINLKVAERMLNEYNLDLDLVGSGKECLDLITSGKKYDIILLDIMMPKMKGPEVLKELKHIPGFDIPVVALTADVISGMEDKYTEQGFDDCLPKPLIEEELYYLLKKYLKETAPKEHTIEDEKDEDGKYITEDLVPRQETPVVETAPVVEEPTPVVEEPKVIPTVAPTTIENELDFELPKLTTEPTPVVVQPTIEETTPVQTIEEENKPVESSEIKEEKQEKTEQFSFNDLPEVNYLSEIMTLSTEQIFQDTQKSEQPKKNTNPIKDLIEKLEEYKNEKNYELYAKAAKKIKDRANEQELKEISEMAYEHELAGKASYEEFINENFKKLKEIIEKTVK